MDTSKPDARHFNLPNHCKPFRAVYSSLQPLPIFRQLRKLCNLQKQNLKNLDRTVCRSTHVVSGSYRFETVEAGILLGFFSTMFLFSASLCRSFLYSHIICKSKYSTFHLIVKCHVPWGNRMVVSFTTTNYLQLQSTLSIPLYGG